MPELSERTPHKVDTDKLLDGIRLAAGSTAAGLTTALVAKDMHDVASAAQSRADYVQQAAETATTTPGLNPDEASAYVSEMQHLSERCNQMGLVALILTIISLAGIAVGTVRAVKATGLLELMKPSANRRARSEARRQALIASNWLA